MRFRILTGLLCLGLVAGQPRTARAGMWDWLEKLSGPGPFESYRGWISPGTSLSVLCLPRLSRDPLHVKARASAPRLLSAGDALCLDDDTVPYVQITVAAAFAESGLGFPGVNVLSMEPMVLFPLTSFRDFNGPTAKLMRSIDVGAGVGFHSFYGGGFERAPRIALQGSARFYPLRPLWKSRRARVVRIEYSPKLIFTNLSDARLGVPERGQTFTPFDEDVEFQGTFRFLIDVGALLKM